MSGALRHRSLCHLFCNLHKKEFVIGWFRSTSPDSHSACMLPLHYNDFLICAPPSHIFVANFIPVKIYTGEDLKPHTAGVLCFKLSPIPHPWRIKMSHSTSLRILQWCKCIHHWFLKIFCILCAPTIAHNSHSLHYAPHPSTPVTDYWKPVIYTSLYKQHITEIVIFYICPTIAHICRKLQMRPFADS